MFESIVAYFTSGHFLFHLELLGRIFIAFLCGAFIGHERKTRGKGAGTRTHSIVSIASCLLMIISQYGFADFLNHFSGTGVNINHDPSRIAAQIVTGIGFLGAGMIFVHKRIITGLTTAAGIWATAGIGMSIGAGMYFISITTTIVIVIIQIISHRDFKFFTHYIDIEYTLIVNDKEKALDLINEVAEKYDLSTTNLEIMYKTDDLYYINIIANTLHNPDRMELANLFSRNDFVVSVKM